MRHLNARRKFNRTPAHRRALFRNLATALLKHGKIETTLEKAKDLRGVVERIITMAKVDNLHNKRQAFSYLEEKEVVRKLFSEIAPKYKERPGGYTRVTKTNVRAGDAAEMAYIELV
ncbi:MAG: 50S ribosomal protein L17 [Bdellovibrionota bacterium]|mgnify:FL=1|nr:50S ribosomal protein L17 [Pseudomonadota bacterium]MDY6090295.1 50S ribosomal protein L17 [Bdellovibrionota bacterium]